METQNPGCVAYCGSRKSGPIGGPRSKISVGCGGRNATAVHPGGAVFFSGTALTLASQVGMIVAVIFGMTLHLPHVLRFTIGHVRLSGNGIFFRCSRVH